MKIEVFVLTHNFIADFPCRLNIEDAIFEDVFPGTVKKDILDTYGKNPNIVVTHSWFTKVDEEIIQGVQLEIE
jgi:hypothetical protein